MAGLGIVGEYIGRIYQEVRGRPRYSVRHIYGSGVARASTPREQREGTHHDGGKSAEERPLAPPQKQRQHHEHAAQKRAAARDVIDGFGVNRVDGEKCAGQARGERR